MEGSLDDNDYALKGDGGGVSTKIIMDYMNIREQPPKKCYKKCKKSKRGERSVLKIKKSTIQNVDDF